MFLLFFWAINEGETFLLNPDEKKKKKKDI